MFVGSECVCSLVKGPADISTRADAKCIVRELAAGFRTEGAMPFSTGHGKSREIERAGINPITTKNPDFNGTNHSRLLTHWARERLSEMNGRVKLENQSEYSPCTWHPRQMTPSKITFCAI